MMEKTGRTVVNPDEQDDTFRTVECPGDLDPPAELSGIGIRNPESAVDRNHEPVQGERDVAGIFLVHKARRVPDSPY
jgi:hypothetical protein